MRATHDRATIECPVCSISLPLKMTVGPISVEGLVPLQPSLTDESRAHIEAHQEEASTNSEEAGKGKEQMNIEIKEIDGHQWEECSRKQWMAYSAIKRAILTGPDGRTLYYRALPVEPERTTIPVGTICTYRPFGIASDRVGFRTALGFSSAADGSTEWLDEAVATATPLRVAGKGEVIVDVTGIDTKNIDFRQWIVNAMKEQRDAQ